MCTALVLATSLGLALWLGRRLHTRTTHLASRLEVQAGDLVVHHLLVAKLVERLQSQEQAVLDAVPLGTILPWVSVPSPGAPHSAKLPRGWQRCGGQNIVEGRWGGHPTPDLNTARRFLRGGGEEDMLRLEDDQVQEHSHEVVDPGHSHGYTDRFTSVGGAGHPGPDGVDLVEDSWGFPHLATTRVARTGVGVGEVLGARTGGETRPTNMGIIFIIKVA